MGFYQDQIVPLLINCSMRQKNLAVHRSRIIPAAEGRVLEIGIGSFAAGFALLAGTQVVTLCVALYLLYRGRAVDTSTGGVATSA